MIKPIVVQTSMATDRSLKTWIEFMPAFDKRDPDPNKDYGVCSVRMRWCLRGPKGAVTFTVLTGWDLPKVREEFTNKALRFTPYIGTDLGYHSPVPLYKEQGMSQLSCSVLDGSPCYYDGSGLQANNLFEVLIAKGHDAVWKMMEKFYFEFFGKKEDT